MIKFNLIAVFLLIILSFDVFAQAKIPEDTVLVFLHKTKDKSKFVKEGKKITYWATDQPKKKGEITKINENSLEIDGQAISFSDINQIRAKSVGLKAVQVAGDVFMVSGTIISAFGAYLLINGYAIQGSDPCNALFSITFGIIFISGGVPIIIIGAIPRSIVGKKYDFSDDWTLKMGTMPDKKQERKNKRELNKK